MIKFAAILSKQIIGLSILKFYRPTPLLIPVATSCLLCHPWYFSCVLSWLSEVVPAVVGHTGVVIADPQLRVQRADKPEEFQEQGKEKPLLLCWPSYQTTAMDFYGYVKY